MWKNNKVYELSTFQLYIVYALAGNSFDVYVHYTQENYIYKLGGAGRASFISPNC